MNAQALLSEAVRPAHDPAHQDSILEVAEYAAVQREVTR